MRFLGITFGVVLLGLGILYARSQPDQQAPGASDKGAARVADNPASSPDPGARESEAKTKNPKPNSKLALHDPIFIGPCHVLPKMEQEIASPVDGLLQSIAVELGQHVRHGDPLGRLDDQQLLPQLELMEIRAKSQAAELIAKTLFDEAETKVKFAEDANKQGLQAVSGLEFQSYLLQRERFAQEMKKAQEDRAAAERELEKTRRLLESHRIRSGLEGEIVKIFKRQGEMVKQAEPLFRIADNNRLRIEGLCKVSLARMLKVDTRALVEPEVRGEPMTRLVGHTAAITGLAVSGDGNWLASASEDRTVTLWSWPAGRRLATLPHPAEVHAVAFSPQEKPGFSEKPGFFRLVTGCADGLVRFWTVTPQGTVEGPRTLPRAHESTVRAVCFSPEGKLCATGGDDRRIAVWDVSAGQHLFWVKPGNQSFGTAHQGAVTAVHLTADSHLISAGRDNTLRIWKLDQGKASLQGSQPGRTGDVAHLGISPDGQRLLFDHGEELRILSRDDWTCLGALQSRKQGHYQGVALFSPSGRLILTASNNGRLQLWKVPAAPAEQAFLRSASQHGFQRSSLGALSALGDGLAGDGRGPGLPALLAEASQQARHLAENSVLPRLWALEGHEVRQFATSGAKGLCAAFAPDERVFFSAGHDKVIYVYPVPPAHQRDLLLEARITYIGSAVERGTDMVRIRAEMDNPADADLRLNPGTFANLRVYPETD